MARTRVTGTAFSIHEDIVDDSEGMDNTSDMEDERTMGSDYGQQSESDDGDEMEDSVAEDLARFQDAFKGITKRFRLINRIGEGTFSTVYKAEDLLYDAYHNNWDTEEKENLKASLPPSKRRRTEDALSGAPTYPQRPRYVAIKKIYVTSSPSRIQNELELLHDLRDCHAVCPLITAFRHQDQVVAVLPYFRHIEFRDYFRDLTISDMRIYFKSLFSALSAVHSHCILHRDIKPTNFLYDINRRRGVLVDFGLAEREGTDCTHCICQDDPYLRQATIDRSRAVQQPNSVGYVKNDSSFADHLVEQIEQELEDSGPLKSSSNAHLKQRFGRLLTSPEEIDIWSSGVILLTMLARRFPFFNSLDDIDALIEIATIFGNRRMRACALLHGTVYECSIPTIGDKGFSFEKIVLWSTGRSRKESAGGNPDADRLSKEELQAIAFLGRCMELDPNKRISAEEALKHEFLDDPEQDVHDPGEEEVDML